MLIDQSIGKTLLIYLRSLHPIGISAACWKIGGHLQMLENTKYFFKYYHLLCFSDFPLPLLCIEYTTGGVMSTIKRTHSAERLAHSVNAL